MPVASPAYLAALDQPLMQPADVLRLALLHEESYDYWEAWLAAQGIEAEMLPGPRLWHAHLTVEAACRGQGVALANHFLFRDDMATGRLVPVPVAGQPLPQLALGTYVFSMRNDRWENPAAACFRQRLRKEVVMHRQALNNPVRG